MPRYNLYSLYLLIPVMMEKQVRFQSTEHFWSFTAKQHCSILLKIRKRWGLILNCKNHLKNPPKTLNGMAPHSLFRVIQVTRSPEIPNYFVKCYLSGRACTSFYGLCDDVFSLAITVNSLAFKKVANVFWDLRASGDLDYAEQATWSCVWIFYFFLRFQTSLHLI